MVVVGDKWLTPSGTVEIDGEAVRLQGVGAAEGWSTIPTFIQIRQNLAVTIADNKILAAITIEIDNVDARQSTRDHERAVRAIQTGCVRREKLA